MNLNSIIPWKKQEPQLNQRKESNDPFWQLQQQMNSVFDNFFGRPSSTLWDGFNGASFAPQIDVSETEKEVRVTAELPGLEEKDVEVTLADQVLTVKGEKRAEQEEEKADYRHTERSYGYFSRSIALPPGVDPEQIKANFRNGLLKVVVPKKPEAQSSRRKIEISSE